MTNKEIGQRIANSRIDQGLTMDDIAQRVGVAKSTIQRYEKGTIKKLKLPVIESIAYALNVNPNWLIGNTDNPTPISIANSTEKEQPAIFSELSEGEKLVLQLFRQIPEDKQAAAIELLRAALKMK